jgi:hypothetical protein
MTAVQPFGKAPFELMTFKIAQFREDLLHPIRLLRREARMADEREWAAAQQRPRTRFVHDQALKIRFCFHGRSDGGIAIYSLTLKVL